jgi:hypothetical protein
MAKVTIIIEDIPHGKVKVVATPNVQEMFQMAESGHDLTSAHGYAFQALNAIRQHSKSQDPTTKILIPRIGR